MGVVFQLQPTKQQLGISKQWVLKYDDGFKIDYHKKPKVKTDLRDWSMCDVDQNPRKWRTTTAPYSVPRKFTQVTLKPLSITS